MNEQFRSRFETGLQQIADSLTKKGGVKQEDKVHQRIGRLKQKYPSIQRYFDIELEVKDDVDINARSGVYFLRTSLQARSEENVWQFYNTVREIEATFRVLKTDLDLRPIYHQKDEHTKSRDDFGTKQS